MIILKKIGGSGPGPVGTSTQSGVQSQRNISESVALSLIPIRYLGVMVSPESTRPVRVQTRKLRGQSTGKPPAAALIARLLSQGGRTSQKLPHCVQASPAPRRHRVTQRSLEPMAASGTQGCCWLRAGLWGEWYKVLTLPLP